MAGFSQADYDRQRQALNKVLNISENTSSKQAPPVMAALRERIIAKAQELMQESQTSEDDEDEGISIESGEVEAAVVKEAEPIKAVPKSQNAFSGMSKDELRRAFIMSEVLGKPKSRR